MTKKELVNLLEDLPDNAVIYLEMYDQRWRNVDCLGYNPERNVVTIGHWRTNFRPISHPPDDQTP